MRTQRFPLSPPSLDELAEALRGPLAANFAESSVTVVPCPDLRAAPFGLAAAGLSGDEKVADVGGMPNLFPRPRTDQIWSMTDIAGAMEMDAAHQGSLIGAGAGPFHVVGQNCELAPNFGWEGGSGGTSASSVLDHSRIANHTRYAEISPRTGAVDVQPSPSLDCALMVNLFGSRGETGPVLRITARQRTGTEASFAACIQKVLQAAYGGNAANAPVSLGGVFVVKAGTTHWHVMPDFPPPEELPFQHGADVDRWLTQHDFAAPMIGFSVMHSADPAGLGLRMEHTHGFSPVGAPDGGHYHYDTPASAAVVEYEGYFNTAKTLYRVDQPEVVVPR